MPASTSEVVRVEAKGYETQSLHITVNAKAKLKHVIELKRKAVRVHMRVRPRGMRTGPGDDLKGLPGD